MVQVIFAAVDFLCRLFNVITFCLRFRLITGNRNIYHDANKGTDHMSAFVGSIADPCIENLLFLYHWNFLCEAFVRSQNLTLDSIVQKSFISSSNLNKHFRVLRMPAYL